MSNLTASTELRREADLLIADTGLLPLLDAEFGMCAIVGSYLFDLLTWRDLDIYVPLGATQFVSIFPSIVQACSAGGWTVFRARYNDECVRPRGEYGKGLYFGLHVASPEGHDWKVDLWGWEPDLYRSKVAQSEELGSALKQLDRGMLLELKTLAGNHPLFRRQLTSQTLYRAALAHPEGSAEQLLALVEAQLDGSVT